MRRLMHESCCWVWGIWGSLQAVDLNPSLPERSNPDQRAHRIYIRWHIPSMTWSRNKGRVTVAAENEKRHGRFLRCLDFMIQNPMPHPMLVFSPHVGLVSLGYTAHVVWA
ncbi:hypothetical protein B0T19DRAFT_420184 [Cercophora scortea]|uniref:Secreted protein n=1 Tax=Cercophora scortea TaxID=314031 RepID=A0AAE0J087_9PEZI|nr:hypothetical protein B0T19DRAFT_420184 [Cercophora scortea]